MNTDETQMKPAEKDFSLQPVTQHLIGAAFEVHNILGFGFLEKVYQRAMQVLNELRGTGIKLGFLINFGRERVEYKRMAF